MRTSRATVGNHCDLCAPRAEAFPRSYCASRFWLLLVSFAAAAGAAQILRAAEPARSVSASDAETNPEEFSEKFQVHLRTNAAPAAGAHTGATNAESKSFHWNVSWRGWQGLEMSVSQSTSLKPPRELLGLDTTSTNPPVFHLEQLKMSGTFGGVVEVDAAAYHTTDNLDFSNDIEVRRARLKALGDCILLLPVSYKIELGYIPNRFNLSEAWLCSTHSDYIGYLKAGFFQPPMGLDLLTSSRDLEFMEPATTLQALAPAKEAGIQIGQPVLSGRGTWALGIFGGGLVMTEYGNASQNYGNLIGRMTYLVLDRIDPAQPSHNRLLHVGLSLNVQYSGSSTVQYRSRPESYIAPLIVDTGKIDADASGAVAAEAAYVRGPFSVQGEFVDSPVRENNGERLNFYGFYASASWFLTGESRRYDRFNGCFARVIPRRNFDFGRGGAWGAFELSGRVSHTDLTDGDISGGRITLTMGELNWYLHSHVRWMFNGGVGHVSGGPSEGNLVLFQSRVGVDF